VSLVKYNNNSISAVTSAASIPSGALTHIKTLTASSSATLSFVDGSSDVVLDNTYPIYKFEFINMHPATNGAYLTFNYSIDSGSNYNVTKTSTAFRPFHYENDSTPELAYNTSNDLAQSTSFQPLCDNQGNNNDDSLSGYFHLFNPSSTTFVKHWISNVNMSHNSSYPASVNWYTAGYGNTTSAVDSIQFKMTSGNIDAGKIKLYGIKDS
jgi:hypothetical protein